MRFHLGVITRWNEWEVRDGSSNAIESKLKNEMKYWMHS